MTTEEHAVAAPEAHERPHPGPAEYVKIALILAVVTAVEVGAYYISSLPDRVFSVMLLVMMAVKFSLVGLWFMHLRFDSKLFRRFFITGIVLAIVVYTIAMTTLGLLVGRH
jgi:cytochrome c oxidase subunit IV